MLLTEKMKEDIFSPSEKAIIAYLFKERENIKDKTTKEISKVTYTHPSHLIRIAKKLGFNGWLELKESFLAEIEYLNSHFTSIDANFPFEERDSIMSIVNKLAILSQTTISDTLSLLNNEDLQKAANLLNKAKHIKIFSSYHNLLLCHAFKVKMKRIRKHVSLINVDPHFEALNSNSETCAVVISYSGENEHIINVMPFLVRKKVPIIVLTSIGENTLTKYADSILRITTRERLYSKIDSFSTNESISFLLNVLYACLFSMDYKNNLEYKIHAAQYYDYRKSSNKVMQEEEHDNME
ncbi:MurR/RpiR family transcriptional regulator [Amphibacillus cookii]|uniref:MurR/RpiR family transcriptional regulator n=1 Tax=Amphibacillus cookii TaxID=767787 RepID=UPI001958191F|nr:MurR/RpiR family transcriptional regulator [Amphibacillus cookii]MBM7543229.1 DNA-binding MurR/RpiR family transcriptional regulator [Amphibacillus cookii]